jgi:hemolysin III
MRDAVAIHEDVKPAWRGVSHQFAFFGAVFAAIALVSTAATRTATVATVVYSLSLCGMLGTSALYHRPQWSLAALRRMRSFDHIGIFLLIAGTYTPVCVVGMPGTMGKVMLAVVWTGAGLGVLHTLFFVHAFRSLNAVLYVLLGCVAVPAMPWLWVSMGPLRTALLAAGGVIYISGAVVYARRWPNPSPRVFGYHEVFHLMVIAAAVLHFTVVLDLVRHAP